MTRRIALYASLLASLAATLAPVRAHAQRCDAPAVMLTVDRSSSMLGLLPDGNTKWDAAVMAIGEITGAYEGGVDFGMQPFPYPDRCEPGRVLLAPGAHTSTEILDALGEPPPSGGNWTPIAQTLDAAAADATMLDATRTRHLILVTDGWQWCDPYAASTRFTPVDSVTRLRALGVTVHVVGFGAAVDSLTLNRAAVAAGTALPGCDPTADAPSDPNHCYAQANDLADLRAALADIARTITEEVCDGDDDDCDGLVDEGYDVDADGYTTCGTVTGGGTDPGLSDCDDAEAVVHPGAAELCDRLDNDCDGVTDPDCECTDGDTVPCGTDVGTCAAGVQRCAGGAWGACEGAIAAVAETCDGTDEDCDGAIDDDADASCGEGRVCTADGCIDVVPTEPEVPVVPPVDEERDDMTPPGRRGSMEGGCACSTTGAGGADGGAAMLLAALAMAIVIRRRTR